MLQIKNTLGGGKPEGLYVWKKNEAVTIPAAHITFENSAWSRDTTNDYMYKAMNSTDVDVSILKKEDFDGATGTTRYGPPDTVSISNGIITYTNSNTTKKCEFKVENGIFYQKGSDTYNHAHYGALTLDIVEHTRMGDFIDYIVSDKETAYPDGGEKGGYWYEKYKTTVKKVTGSFAGSSYTTTYTINHNGNMDVIGIYVTGSTGNYSIGMAVVGSEETGFSGLEASGNGNRYTPSITITDENTCKITFGNSSGPGAGNKKYTVYGMAR